MMGDILDMGRLPGSIRFELDGFKLKLFNIFGEEKSSIWLLKIIPVVLPQYLAPKLKSIH